jgi:hypothetical protein
MVFIGVHIDAVACMGMLERVTAPHSSKLTVDKCLPRKGPEKKSLTFSYIDPLVNASRYTENLRDREILKLSPECNRLSLPTQVSADVDLVDALRVPPELVPNFSSQGSCEYSVHNNSHD